MVNNRHIREEFGLWFPSIIHYSSVLHRNNKNIQTDERQLESEQQCSFSYIELPFQKEKKKTLSVNVDHNLFDNPLPFIIIHHYCACLKITILVCF